MKKILVIILCAPQILLAQTEEKKHSIEWNTDLIIESSSLDKTFLNTMLYGGYITDSIKNKWINAGENNNILFSEISNELRYNFERNSSIYGFSILDRNILNASFSDDLLRLAFEGNYYYQGKTLDFGGTNIRVDRFQQYKFKYGIITNQVNISASISYLSGNHHLSYIIENGSLYTSPFGTSIDIAYDMSAFVTDTTSLSPLQHNGNGLALGLCAEFQFKKQTIHLSFSDLGFIMWNPNSIILASDSNFNFSPIEINDIFDINDSILESNNLNEDILNTNKASFKSYIPAIFHFRISGNRNYKYFKKYTLGLKGKWQPYLDNTPLSFKKIQQGFNESNFIPLYYIQSVLTSKYFDIVPTISYGGYSSKTNLGLAISKGKKHSFTIGTHHLEDLLKSISAKAISIYFNIKLQF